MILNALGSSLFIFYDTVLPKINFFFLNLNFSFQFIKLNLEKWKNQGFNGIVVNRALPPLMKDHLELQQQCFCLVNKYL